MSREPYLSTQLNRNTRQFRLLNIAAGSNDRDDLDEPLVIGLETCSLSCDVNFSALSYVWGEDLDKEIVCAGTTIKISLNCFDALTHLRRRLGSYTIWVDAICINQMDLEEKSWQIALMEEIYSKAKTVYVWLGAGSESTDRAMRFVQADGLLYRYLNNTTFSSSTIALLRDLNTWSLFWQLFRKRWMRNSCLPSYLDNGQSNLSSFTPLRFNEPISKRELFIWYQNHSIREVCFALVQDFRALLSREWIQRIWTYQEIVLSSNPVVICGHQMVPWDQLALYITILECFSTMESGNAGEVTSLFTTWRKVSLTRSRLRKALTRHKSHVASGCGSGNRLQEQSHRLYQILHIYMWLRKISWYIFIFAASGAVTTIVLVAHCAAFSHQSICYQHYRYLYISLLVVCSAASLSLGIMLWLGQSTSLPSVSRESLIDIRAQIEQDHTDDMVNAICQRKAGQPRDKAFGMRSVLSHILIKELPLPDYHSPLHEVFQALTLNLLHATDSMQPLLAAAIKPMAGAPSWVADWSADFSAYWLQPPLMYQNIRHAACRSRPFFRYQMNTSGSILVRGRLICTVKQCVQLRHLSSEYLDTERRDHIHNLDVLRNIASSDVLRHTWNIVRSQGRRPFRRWIPYLPEFRDLICNFKNHSDLPRGIGLDVLTGYWKLLCSSVFASSSLSLLQRLERRTGAWLYLSFHANRSRGRLSTNVWAITVSFKDLMRAHIAVCNSLSGSGKQFFSTDDMVPLCTNVQHNEQSKGCGFRHQQKTAEVQNTRSVIQGLCKTNVQPGDRVLLVAGLSVPLVVRQERDGYRLISPAIISCVMQGQAWPCGTTESTEDALQYFTII